MPEHSSRFAYTLAAFLAILPATAWAETPGEACDRLAASIADTSLPASVKSVTYETLDAEAALKVCAEAVAASPDNARYHIQYGRALNKTGKLKEALAEYEQALRMGSWGANVLIADMYAYGDFGTPDQKKAFELYSEAAKRDIPVALRVVGLNYRDGKGTEIDLKKSLEMLMKADALGDKAAAIDIGWAHENGLTVKVDHVEAMRWYMKGAAQGDAIAMNNVGALYSQGRGVPKDDVKALAWFRRSQAEGEPYGIVNVAAFTDQGRMTDKNHALAVELVLSAFGKSDAESDKKTLAIFDFYKWSPEFWTLMQQTLAERGFYKGTIDGKMSDETRAAFLKIMSK